MTQSESTPRTPLSPGGTTSLQGRPGLRVQRGYIGADAREKDAQCISSDVHYFAVSILSAGGSGPRGLEQACH